MPIRPRSVLGALAALWMFSAAAAQPASTPYVFSERVGPEIDAAERDYFGLFPGAGAEASARAFAVGDSVEVVVAGAAEPEMRVTMTRGTAAALGGFIETFEQAEATFYNPNWQLVSRLVRPDVPVPYVEPRRDVYLDVGGRRYSGAVLAASDSLVLIQPGEAPYDWRLRNALALRSADIERVAFGPSGIERYGKVAPLVGGGAGALVGIASVAFTSNDVGASRGFVTIPLLAVLGYELTRRLWPHPVAPGTYGERRGALAERARFRAGRQPYDLPRLASLEGQQEYEYEPVPEPSRRSLFRRWYQQYGVLSVGFMGVGTVATRPEGSVYTEFVRGIGEREQANVRNELGVVGGVDVSLRPVPWVRVGGTWLSRDDTDVAEIGAEVVNVQPSSFRGYAEAVLPLPSFGGLRADVAVGLGREENTMSVERAVAPGADPRVAYRTEQSWSNTFWQGTAEVFTSRRASFFVRLTHRSFSRTIPVEEIDIRVAALPGTTSYRLDAHDVRFEGFTEVMWGTRLHL